MIRNEFWCGQPRMYNFNEIKCIQLLYTYILLRSVLISCREIGFSWAWIHLGKYHAYERWMESLNIWNDQILGINLIETRVEDWQFPRNWTYENDPIDRPLGHGKRNPLRPSETWGHSSWWSHRLRRTTQSHLSSWESRMTKCNTQMPPVRS